MKQALKGLKPEAVFHYFEEICSIPHGSGNIDRISDYLKKFAHEHSLKCIQDAKKNIIIFVPGTCDKENNPPVILQGHMDMVCEKEPDSQLDLTVDPIEADHDDRFVYAHDTTLGGDDGIAVAYCLALAADTSIAHPPLEILVTTDEEIGMLGAEYADLTSLNGRMLINVVLCQDFVQIKMRYRGASAGLRSP